MAIRLKIKEIREYRNMTQDDVVRISGVKKRSYVDYESGKTDIPSSKLQDIANALGVTVGTIFGYSNPETRDRYEDRVMDLNFKYKNVEIDDSEVEFEDEGGDKHTPQLAEKGVPYFNVDFSSGFDYFENSQVNSASFYIDYEPYNNADFWVNNTGNSMSPKIESGDIVALKKMSDLRQMIYGEIYAVVMPEMRTIKYIRKSEKDGCLRFVPENIEDFDEQDMPIELIQSFFLVLGAIKKFF